MNKHWIQIVCNSLLVLSILFIATHTRAEEPVEAPKYTESEVIMLMNEAGTRVLRAIALACIKEGAFKLTTIDDKGDETNVFFDCKPMKSI